MWAFNAAVLVAVWLGLVGVFCRTNFAACDAKAGAFYACTVGAVVLLKVSLTVGGEAIFSALNAGVVCVAKAFAFVFGCTNIRGLIGVGALHTLVSFAIGCAGAFGGAAIAKDGGVA